MGRKPTVNLNLPPRMRARRRWNTIYYYYDYGGKPRREEPLGSNFVLAVKRWSEIEGAQAPQEAQPTFKEAAGIYVREVLPMKAPRTQTDNLKELLVLREFFDDEALLDEIEPMHIKQYLRWRHQKAVAWYVEKKRPAPPDAGHVRGNREIALFSHIFNYAREIGLTKVANPCVGVRKNTEDGRDVYVEDDMYARLYAKADQPTRDAMDLAYLAGQRPQDTLGYDERDIKNNFLLIDQGKTGKKLRMELMGELKTVIERIRARKATYKVVSTALVVTESGDRMTLRTLQYRFRMAREAAGIPQNEFQFRDLRAKAGTDKTDSTGDIRQAQKQLGHESLAMTEHYVRKRRGDKVGPTK
ncbi:Tyrosine recombinase XerC [Paraburkholderia ultramafica]|uniref:Tyrosine recombinase XerC n=1 Tax=Paraburkholderia ultramafica TaxID=1544867 RepID=A0A6S7CZB9_9BURK|nr:tyrosine-type recombinase/integrase [Paraburkholderia ultramafica]CAB3801809.1 Tyrosine recombinase XerC [Paraburkholderia ultramafica]